MATHNNETFENQTVDLDGNEFESCTFKSCELIFSGGEPPTLINNKFVECRWGFDEAAARTIQFMRAMYDGGGRSLIESTFARIRGEHGGFATPG